MNVSSAKRRFVAVVLLLSWCCALIVYRMFAAATSYGEKSGFGLLWNLFLAILPLFWGAIFKVFVENKRPRWAGLFFALWLLFLPNAPYLLTDLIHLAPRHGVPLWYLLAMLLSCAGTGTLLGYMSLCEVQSVVEEQWSKRAGWLVAFGALMLCGFGIYIGRFLRWNSWNVVTHPVSLSRNVARQFVDSGPFPHPASVTLVFGIGLIVGYVALRAMAQSMRENQ